MLNFQQIDLRHQRLDRRIARLYLTGQLRGVRLCALQLGLHIGNAYAFFRFGLRADFRGGAIGIIRHRLFDGIHISGNIRQLLLQLDGMLGNARQLRNQLVHRRIHGLKLRFDLILLFGGIGQLLLDCGTFRFRLIQLLF